MFSSYLLAKEAAKDHNDERPLQHIRRRPAEPEVSVFSLLIRRKKDANRQGTRWFLLRKTNVRKMTDDEAKAEEVLAKLKKGKVAWL